MGKQIFTGPCKKSTIPPPGNVYHRDDPPWPTTTQSENAGNTRVNEPPRNPWGWSEKERLDSSWGGRGGKQGVSIFLSERTKKYVANPKREANRHGKKGGGNPHCQESTVSEGSVPKSGSESLTTDLGKLLANSEGGSPAHPKAAGPKGEMPATGRQCASGGRKKREKKQWGRPGVSRSIGKGRGQKLPTVRKQGEPYV